MAKGQKRPNREAKKPKAEKKKPEPPANTMKGTLQPGKKSGG